MKILMVAAGSHGDVLPFVALGRELQQRGHELHLFASGAFAAMAAQAGLPFTEVMTAAEYQGLLADRDATDPRKGMHLLDRAVMDTQRRGLALFPAWFAPPQPDWPAGLQLTGFPLYDHGEGAALPPEVQAFLDAGAPPVAFTAGTANASSHAFFDASLRACQLSGRRGLLLTQDSTQVPAGLPPHVAHFGYVPFKALLPRLAALVHHGGIGTTSQALLAGVPQLVRPMGFDQFDNARRVVTLGAGRQLLPRQYKPAAVAKALDELVGGQATRSRCAELASTLAAERPGAAVAADAVLALAAARRLA